MAENERTRSGGGAVKALICVGLLAGAGAAGMFLMKPSATRRPERTVAKSNINEQSSLEAIAAALPTGDGMALAVLQKRLAVAPGALIPPIAEGESAAWRAIAEGLKRGFARFAPYGRASAAITALRILEKYGVKTAPVDWAESMQPIYQTVTAALTDTDASVRSSAIHELGRFWKWSPGRELETTGELDYVAEWKEAIYIQLVRALGDADGSVRARAVGAISALPIDVKAATAAARINDPSFEVRLYVLAGFADRRNLLDDEAVVALLYDPVPAVATAAENTLKQRGLTPEQIGLCKLIVHPLSHMRASVIPMLQTRTDVDPTIWLVFLSRDKDVNVQMKAVEALGAVKDEEARRRLAEMAIDPKLAPDIREAAAKLAPPGAVATTVALPPLPGSASLNPRAN